MATRSNEYRSSFGSAGPDAKLLIPERALTWRFQRGKVARDFTSIHAGSASHIHRIGHRSIRGAHVTNSGACTRRQAGHGCTHRQGGRYVYKERAGTGKSHLQEGWGEAEVGQVFHHHYYLNQYEHRRSTLPQFHLHQSSDWFSMHHIDNLFRSQRPSRRISAHHGRDYCDQSAVSVGTRLHLHDST